MKLVDIAYKIDKSENNEDCINTDALSSEFEINFPLVINPNRIKVYWIGNWYCTDTWVGYRMYFFDGEPVAVSEQIGRKCIEDFKWFSEEAAYKVRDYLISLMDKDEEPHIKTIDINEDVGDSYKISYNEELLEQNKPYYQGNPVEILEKIKEEPDYGIGQELKIKLSDGYKKIVDIRDLDFKFYIISTEE